MHDVTTGKPSGQFDQEKLCSHEENFWIGRVCYVVVEEYEVVLILTKSLGVQNGTFPAGGACAWEHNSLVDESENLQQI
jgi:hypothetical protein